MSEFVLYPPPTKRERKCREDLRKVWRSGPSYSVFGTRPCDNPSSKFRLSKPPVRLRKSLASLSRTPVWKCPMAWSFEVPKTAKYSKGYREWSCVLGTPIGTVGRYWRRSKLRRIDKAGLGSIDWNPGRSLSRNKKSRSKGTGMLLECTSFHVHRKPGELLTR